jgi:hypothetical protein
MSTVCCLTDTYRYFQNWLGRPPIYPIYLSALRANNYRAVSIALEWRTELLIFVLPPNIYSKRFFPFVVRRDRSFRISHTRSAFVFCLDPRLLY